MKMLCRCMSNKHKTRKEGTKGESKPPCASLCTLAATNRVQTSSPRKGTDLSDICVSTVSRQPGRNCVSLVMRIEVSCLNYWLSKWLVWTSFNSLVDSYNLKVRSVLVYYSSITALWSTRNSWSFLVQRFWTCSDMNSITVTITLVVIIFGILLTTSSTHAQYLLLSWIKKQTEDALTSFCNPLPIQL